MLFLYDTMFFISKNNDHQTGLRLYSKENLMSQENQSPPQQELQISVSSEYIAIESNHLEQVSQYLKRCQDRYTELEELLEFASENGKLDPPELASQIKELKKILFYTPLETLNYEMLWQVEADTEKLYSRITHLVDPVTIETLRTTSERYRIQRPWWSAWLLGSSCQGRNIFRQLFWVAVPLVGLIFFRQYINLKVQTQDMQILETWVMSYNLMLFLDPFLFGAIGAWIYLYKTLNDLYTVRCLHPRKLSTDWLRLFMGALSGGLLVHVLFPDLVGGGKFVTQESLSGTSSSGETVQEMKTTLSFSASAVGFLAGYSVDFFYRTLDRMIRAILPRSTEEATPITPKQQQMELLLKRLQETGNEEDKVVIRKMLENL